MLILRQIRPLVFAAALTISSTLFAAQEIPIGSDLRQELFDSIRAQAEELADKPVKFQGSMKQEGNFAVFIGQLVDKNGKSIPIGDAESPDAFGLWQKKSGEWKLIEFNAGYTDVFYLDYPKTYGVPESLLVP